MSRAQTSDTRLVVEPNASLSWRDARRFLMIVGAVAFVVAGWCALRGLWPVLVFAAANLVALGVALVVCLRHNAYREVLSFDGDEIRLAFGFAGRGVAFRATVPRRVVRAMVEKGPYRTSPTRLVLRWDGRCIEVGQCLTDAERVDLCCRIRQLLQPGWERPQPIVSATPETRAWD
ncbi:MAG: DUF2244 domain-containing protein [Sinobacteraceae bacterium]|nr:DUF2244 domain-containing protein [Nevskiaceae bacterium]